MSDNSTCRRCGAPQFAGDQFCPACGLANPDGAQFDRDGFSISGTTQAVPPPKPDMKSSIIGIGALMGVLTLITVLFFVTAPDEIDPEGAIEPTPTATPEPTPTEVPLPTATPVPEATAPPPSPTPTPDLGELFGSLDLGPGRLVVAEIGEVASYDLETGDRQQITSSVLNTTVVPVISWRGVSWRPADENAWVTNFWGGDLEQSPLPADFDPGFSVGAPLDGAVYTEVVFGSIEGGRQLLATHLATGEDVLIDLPADVREQVLAGWPPQVKSLRDSLYISSGSRIYRWQFSAREWVDLGPGTIVSTTGPGVLISDCSIAACSVRTIDATGESTDLPEVSAAILPSAPGEFGAFSPDGSELAYYSIGFTPTLRGQRIVRNVELTTGIVWDTPFDNQNLEARNLFWAPTGDQVIVTLQSPASLRATLVMLDPETGDQLELPLDLDRANPFALVVDIDRLRGLPTITDTSIADGGTADDGGTTGDGGATGSG